MGLDIRLPIGLMFSVFGVLLVLFGAFSDKSIYSHSLGINVNLIWGVVLLAFGIVMLMLGRRGMAAIEKAAEEALHRAHAKPEPARRGH